MVGVREHNSFEIQFFYGLGTEISGGDVRCCVDFISQTWCENCMNLFTIGGRTDARETIWKWCVLGMEISKVLSKEIPPPQRRENHRPWPTRISSVDL